MLAKQSQESGDSRPHLVFMRLEALSVERKGLLDERERQREELNHLRELSHRQQRRLQEKDGASTTVPGCFLLQENQLSAVEASLTTNQQALLKRR